MASTNPNDTKTILELALELGVRSETIIKSMQKIGLEPDAGMDTQIESGLESSIIEQMVEDGNAPDNLAKGKGRRKHSGDEPFVDDELMKEALGASDSGFQESHIPRQILLESSFEKPTFFDKLFGKKKKNLAKSIKNHELSEQELELLFSEQNFDEPAFDSPTYIEDAFSTDAVDDQIQPEEDFSDLEDIDIDEDVLTDIDELELEDHDETISDDQLKELSETFQPEDLDEDFATEALEQALSEEVDEDIDLDALEGIDDIDDIEDLGELDELDELDHSELEVLASGNFSVDDEEEPAPALIDRIFSKIHLTQTEMWALMACSLTTMLLVLGFVVYWWFTQSPQAQDSFLEQANQHFAIANDIKGEINQGRTWPEARAEYYDAAENYQEFIKSFPDHPAVKSVAFPHLCESYYQIATGNEQYLGMDEAKDPYRLMSQLYERYLDYLNNYAQRISQIADQEAGYLSYPDVEEQQEALFRIAMAQRKLQNFDRAISRLEEFVNQYSESPHALKAQVEIAKTYQDWAEINKEDELPLLQKAREAYEKSLQPAFVPEEDHIQRLDLYAGLGDIAYRLYEVADNQEKSKADLLEAIASYENAEQEYRAATSEPASTESVSIEDKVKIFQTLANLYMIRGREVAEKWRGYEKLAMDFAEGIIQREQLLNDADHSRQQAENYFSNARALYDELLEDRDLLPSDVLFEILYHTAESHHIMREYPSAISTGEDLLSILNEQDESDNPQSTVKLQKAKTNYLLGHAAWEQARQDSVNDEPVDYSDVKKYYRNALEQDPFYPTEENGAISHLADIRLTNVYFLLDGDYEQAISNFERQVKNYPDTGYTYLTLNFYGNALEEYGDQLMDQAQTKLNQMEANDPAPQLRIEADNLKNKAKDLFSQAVTIYDRAITARENSTVIDINNKTYLIDATFNKAHSAYKAGRYKEAEVFFNNAIEEFGDTSVGKLHVPKAVERLGDLHAKMGNYSQAVKHYRNYLDEAYENSNARVSMKLANAYLSQFSYDKARNQYERIIKYYPPPSERRIQQLQRLGGTMATDTPGFDAMKKLAQSYYQQAATHSGEERINFLNQALDAYEQLANSYPNINSENNAQPLPADFEAQRMIGNINFELGNYARAAESYESILQNQPNYPRQGQLYYRLGKAYTETQDYRKAINSLNNINLNVMDNNIQYAEAIILQAQAYELLAEEYLANGDKLMHSDSLEKAIQTYNRVSQTGVKDKIVDARIKSQAIQSVLEGEKVISNQSVAQQP